MGPEARARQPVSMSIADQPARVLLTASEHRAHEQELRRLRTLRDSDLRRRLREARTYVTADAVEDIGHIQEEQVIVDTRIARLAELLDQATVIPDAEGADTVTLGCTVEVRYAATGVIATYHLTGAGVSKGTSMSSGSPVGRALMGCRTGDTVTVDIPRGDTVALTVLGITAAAPA